MCVLMGGHARGISRNWFVECQSSEIPSGLPWLYVVPSTSPMEITLGQQYNVGEKPTVILYIYFNRQHAGTPETH